MRRFALVALAFVIAISPVCTSVYADEIKGSEQSSNSSGSSNDNTSTLEDDQDSDDNAKDDDQDSDDNAKEDDQDSDDNAQDDDDNSDNDDSDDSGGAQQDDKQPSYPADYDYESALKDSYIAGQLVQPFGSTLRTMLTGDDVKKTLTSLYSEQNGNLFTLNYRDLLYKDTNDEYKLAQVKHLFNTDNSGKGETLYVKYKVKVGVDENGRPKYEIKYKPVYHANPYSYYYVTLAVGKNENEAGLFIQNLDTKIQMDQYGNIVLNQGSASSSSDNQNVSGSGNGNHYMIIPNFSNPDLNGGKFYLPSRLFLDSYDTACLGNMASSYSLESGYPNRIKYSTYKNKVGKAAIGSSIGVYLFPETNRVNLGDILTKENLDKEYLKGHISIPKAVKTGHNIFSPSEEYLRFCNSKPEDYSDTTDPGEYLVTVFGNNYNKYFLNKFQNDRSMYGNLSEVGHTGFGANASFAVLPNKNIFMGGAMGMKEYTVDMKGDIGDGSCGKWSFLMHQASGEALNDFGFNSRTDWTADPTPDEINFLVQMMDSFNQSLDFSPGEDNDDSIFNVIAYLSVGVESAVDDVTSSNAQAPNMDNSKKSNGILDIVYHYLTNIGSSQVAMHSSKMSVSYSHLLDQMTENYLFHISNVFQNNFLIDIIHYYMLTVMSFNLIWIVLRLLKFYSAKQEDVHTFIKKTLFALIISVLPYATVLYYSNISEMVTTKLFRDTFVYWSLVDLDSVNRASELQQQYAQSQEAYFRERGVVDFSNHGIVKVYSGSIGTPEEDITPPDIKIFEDIFLGLNGAENRKYNLASLSEVYRSLAHGTAGSDSESIMANTQYYSNSIFYYFYDTLRLRYYDYYQSIGQSMSSGFSDSNGMINTWGTVLSMFSDPYFLYGPIFITGADGKPLASEQQAQDILGLTNLFSSVGVGNRESYYQYIENSEWYTDLKSNTNFTLEKFQGNSEYLDNTNPDNYKNSVIRGARGEDDIQDLSSFELALQEVNNRCAQDLLILNDYSKYSDESILFMGAMICTMEFNSVMNSKMNPNTKLVPITFEGSSYSLDTIFRSMFLDNNDEQVKYQGDLMWAIENKGGTLVQGIVILTTFVGQLAGIENLVAIVILFIMSSIVYVVAYSIKKNISNKAWLGLICIMATMLLIHTLFILLVKWICIPTSSVIQDSLFGGYTNGIRALLLLVILIARIVAIGVILYFAFIHYSDLGGEIIVEGMSNIGGNIRDFTSHIGSSKQSSESTTLESDSVEVLDENGNVIASNPNTALIESDVSGSRELAELSIDGDKMSVKEDKEIQDAKEVNPEESKDDKIDSVRRAQDISDSAVDLAKSEISEDRDSDTSEDKNIGESLADTNTIDILPYGEAPQEDNNSNVVTSENNEAGEVNIDTANSNVASTSTDLNSESIKGGTSTSTDQGTNILGYDNDSEGNVTTASSALVSSGSTEVMGQAVANGRDVHSEYLASNAVHNNSTNISGSNTSEINEFASALSNITNNTTNETNNNETNTSNIQENTSNASNTINSSHLTLQEELNRLLNIDASARPSVSSNNIFSSENIEERGDK